MARAGKARQHTVWHERARQGKAGQDSVVRCRTDECNVIQCSPQSKKPISQVTTHHSDQLIVPGAEGEGVP